MLGKMFFLGLGLADIFAILGVISLFLFPLLKTIKNWILSKLNIHIKEKHIIERINLELNNNLNSKKYMLDIIKSESKTLKNLSLTKIKILFNKDISYKNLKSIIELTNKDLCFYENTTGKIQLVDLDKYKEMKKNDINLCIYLMSCGLAIIVYLLLLWHLNFISHTLKFFSIDLTEIENITLNVIFLLALYITIFFFEGLWLLGKSPYDSYEELCKDSDNRVCLAKQNIIVQESPTE